MKLRFVVLPPVDTGKYASRLGKKFVAKQDYEFIVDNKEFFSHITLFSVELDSKGLRSLFETTRAFAKVFSVIALDISGLSTYPDLGGGWVAMRISYSRKLTGLRNKLGVLITSNPFVSSVGMTKYFKLHITMTKLKDLDAVTRLLNRYSGLRKSFRMDIVAITLYDDTGQVSKIIKKFRLK